MELSPELQSLQRTIREVRNERAEQQGITEGHSAAQALSPTMEGFFMRVSNQVVETDAGEFVDTDKAKAEWVTPEEAQELMNELEFRDLLETTEAGQLIISDLGREALRHLPN